MTWKIKGIWKLEKGDNSVINGGNQQIELENVSNQKCALVDQEKAAGVINRSEANEQHSHFPKSISPMIINAIDDVCDDESSNSVHGLEYHNSVNCNSKALDKEVQDCDRLEPENERVTAE
ncbi:hypothetical protein RHGRI_024184 [Rhododendron griersonianum]|uniref:Uncharacterized protein n=1 Tax=Rhododendron griersonianum TaxID=479676 RepID=A0AAV6JA46_9ERIC|nr:hypothetical protein RHGRI_024184 [Rhododendron griersonianum]